MLWVVRPSRATAVRVPGRRRLGPGTSSPGHGPGQRQKARGARSPPPPCPTPDTIAAAAPVARRLPWPWSSAAAVRVIAPLLPAESAGALAGAWPTAGAAAAWLWLLFQAWVSVIADAAPAGPARPGKFGFASVQVRRLRRVAGATI